MHKNDNYLKFKRLKTISKYKASDLSEVRNFEHIVHDSLDLRLRLTEAGCMCNHNHTAVCKEIRIDAHFDLDSAHPDPDSANHEDET